MNKQETFAKLLRSDLSLRFMLGLVEGYIKMTHPKILERMLAFT